MDKQAQVLAHLKKHRSITQVEAIQLCWATRLSAIVSRLKDKGYIIESCPEYTGEGIRYVRYRYRGRVKDENA